MATATEQLEPLAYTQVGAARALNVDARTIRRWVRKGLLRPTVIGGVKRYARADLIQLLTSGKATSEGNG